MSVLHCLLSSCLYSVVFYLHICAPLSSIFISVLRGLLSSCLYSMVFYLHVCTPWSSILNLVLRGLLSLYLYSVLFYLHVCTLCSATFIFVLYNIHFLLCSFRALQCLALDESALKQSGNCGRAIFPCCAPLTMVFPSRTLFTIIFYSEYFPCFAILLHN
jgi:hypothetical protein